MSALLGEGTLALLTKLRISAPPGKISFFTVFFALPAVWLFFGDVDRLFGDVDDGMLPAKGIEQRGVSRAKRIVENRCCWKTTSYTLSGSKWRSRTSVRGATINIGANSKITASSRFIHYACCVELGC